MLSVGGNDALSHRDILERPAVMDTFAALSELTDILEDFEDSYRSCLAQVLAHSLPPLVCTIYTGAFVDPSYPRVISTVARLFDDVIMQCAVDSRCPVVDLRRVCRDSSDYYNPIEPNAEGGRKIASAILSALNPGLDANSFIYPSGPRP